MITVPVHVLTATFSQFREHGNGEEECVVFWIGPTTEPDRVDEVVHPVHTSNLAGYQIDDQWLTGLWLRLARQQKSIRVQVHTHPLGAFHSKTDDDWPVIPDTGFLSLVIPNFALGPIGFDGAYLTQRRDDGRWFQVSPDQHLEVIE